MEFEYDVSYQNFLTALGEEFCEALSPPVSDDLIVPHDGYEVWRRAFGSKPSPVALAALDSDGVERLLAACVAYFECLTVSAAAIQMAVSRTLARWPVADADQDIAGDRGSQPS